MAAKKQTGGKISLQGYKRTSKDKDAPMLTIPGGNITMDNVPHPVVAYPQYGQPVMMYPGQQYQFPGSQYVNEVPVRQVGGYIPPRQQQEVQTRNYIPPIQGPGFTNNIVLAGKPWEGKPTYIAPQQQNTGQMQAAAPKRSTINKAGQILRHPMTAAEYKMRGQDIPDYLEYGDKNKLDNAIDIINPMTYIDAGKRVVTAENFRDPNQSFGEALLKTGLDAAMVIPIAKGIKPGSMRIRVPDKLEYNEPIHQENLALDRTVSMNPFENENHWNLRYSNPEKFNKLRDLAKRQWIETPQYRDLPVLKFDPNAFKNLTVNQELPNIPGFNYSPTAQNTQQHTQENGVPFYLNTQTSAPISQSTIKRTVQRSPQKKVQHIGEGAYTVVGAETPDGQFIYHYPTKAQADSVVSQYQNTQQFGGNINNNTMKKNKYQKGGNVGFHGWLYDDPRMSNLGMVPPFQMGGQMPYAFNNVGMVLAPGTGATHKVSHNPASQNGMMAFGGIIGASTMGSVPPYFQQGGPVIQEGFFPDKIPNQTPQGIEPQYYAPQYQNAPQQQVQGQYNPPTPMMPLGFDSRLPQPQVGFNRQKKNGGCVDCGDQVGMEHLQSMIMKTGGIHIKPENKGKFTAWAKSHGMGVQEAASHVLANKDKYSSTIVKRANFARNFGGHRKDYGGYVKGSQHELEDHEIQDLISKGYKVKYL